VATSTLGSVPATVTVVGAWELGDSVSPLTESYLWAWPLREFGVTEWRMWPVSGIRCPERTVTLTEFHDINAALEGLSGQRVFLEPDNSSFPLDTIMLHEFEHPEDAIYIFGSNHFNPTVGRITDDDVALQLPTVKNSGVLWPHQVMVTVLYDRLVKSWR